MLGDGYGQAFCANRNFLLSGLGYTVRVKTTVPIAFPSATLE